MFQSTRVDVRLMNAWARWKEDRGCVKMMLEAVVVLRTAEKSRPRAALDIYRQYAEEIIRQRSRNSYPTACKYLKRTRELYKQLGEEREWTSYVTKLRETNRNLRALMEEMSKAKL